ncbi:hypothetical protein GGI22_005245, partial [Coemansia erecta]
ETADGSSPPLETDQRESTLGVEEQPRQEKDDDKENALDTGVMPQRESPKDASTAEGDVTLSREICDLEDRINYCLQSFDEAPFTIQRIAELLVWPERHYRGAIKFLRAIERVVYVTSTVEDFPPTTTQTKESTDSANDEVEDDMNNIPVAIEGVEGSVGGNEGVPPLDASDTGILHITSTSSEEGDTLRSRISESIDAAVPVCIDGPDGSIGKFAVQPISPLHIPAPGLTTSEITGLVDESKPEKNKSVDD